MENQTPTHGSATDAADDSANSSAKNSAINSATLVAGQCLTDAREARGLSLADVSEQTRIPQMHLRALERNDPDSLPARPFLAGYLRSYAVLLDMDATQLLAAYGLSSSESRSSNNTEASDSNGSKPTVGVGWSTYPEAQHKSVRWRLGVVVVLPLLAISVLAWVYHVIDGKLSNVSVNAEEFAEASPPDSLGPLASTVVIAQADNDLAVGNVAYPGSEDINGLDASMVDAVAITEDSTEVALTSRASGSGSGFVEDAGNIYAEEFFVAEVDEAANIANVVEPDDRGNISDSVSVIAATTEPAVEVSQALAQAEAQAVSQATTQSAQAPTQSATTSPGAAAMVAQFQQRDRLVIWVREDSWIDVSDSVGNRLYRDLARAGKKIDVSGNLPFSLHLGNAPGLALELNGESFAITNYRDDNSARVTLGSR